jgi:tRNA(Met) cytidine acetyltransferase
MLLAGKVEDCRQHARQIVNALAVNDSLWIGDGAPSGVATLGNSQALQRLGGELDLLIYDAFSGFDPDAFGALAGTLRGGALLLLLTPSLEIWPSYMDPEHTRIAIHGYSADNVGGGFLQRLTAILQSDPYVVRQDDGEWVAEMVAKGSDTLPSLEAATECLTPDQQQAVEAIERVVHGHRRRPLVLSSDRGRGKSSALGIAAARLMRESTRTILVTAPRRSAADALFHQALRLLPEAELKQGNLHYCGSLLTYTAPDHLLGTSQAADLLLVDEAAAIPTNLLEGLLEHYPRLVFATTVHGYEGTGRGFALRFRAYLDQRTPQWREIELRTPIRWAKDDPLEPLVFRMLGLDASPVQDESAATVDETVETLMPDANWLLQHEPLLQQLFGLLVLAHYRTTPLDLRLLLDAPNLKTLLLCHRGSVVGAALLSVEGEFDTHLAQDIWAGRRRPKGHLLAQSLAAHVGLVSAPCLKGLRVVRIAIHPAAQGRGWGSYLLKRIEAWALEQGFDYLGTSFGASEALFGFWLRNGLRPVRLGLRTSTSSGDYSLLMIAPLSHQGEVMARQADSRFASQLPAILGDPMRDLSPSLAARLLAASAVSDQVKLTSDDWETLAGFAFAHRGYETSLPAIQRLALIGLGHDDLSAADRELMLMRVVQQRPWNECARLTALSGRFQIEQRLREIMGLLYRQFANQSTTPLAYRLMKPNNNTLE